MKVSRFLLATAATSSLCCASWQGIRCKLSNILKRANSPCPALRFPYLTLPLSPPPSLPTSPFSGSLALTSVTQIEAKNTKLGKLADFVASLFPSRWNVAETTRRAEHSESSNLAESLTVPFVTDSKPVPFFTINSKSYYYAEYWLCSSKEYDSFYFNSTGLPSCSLNVMSNLDVCLSYRRTFKLRSRSCSTSCYASISTRKLEREHLKEPFENRYGGALAYVKETIDCKGTDVGYSKPLKKSLNINDTLTVQNRSVNWSHTKTLNGTVEPSCKRSHKLELLGDGDIKKREATETCFKFLADSTLCNQGGKRSSSESVTDFRSRQEDHQAYWEQLTSFQKEQAITMIEAHFNKPQSLDIGSDEYNIIVPTFVAAFAALVAVFAAFVAAFVAAFAATIALLARRALIAAVNDIEGSEVVTDESEVVTEVSEVETAKEEPVKASNEESAKAFLEAFTKLQRDSREAMKEFKKELLNEFLALTSEESKEVSYDQPKEESEEDSLAQKEPEVTSEEASTEDSDKASKAEPKEASRIEPQEESNEEPAEASIEDQVITSIEESKEEPEEALNEELMVFSIEGPKEETKTASLEKPHQESVEEFINYLRLKREIEKRKLKNQKKSQKKKEKRLQKFQAKQKETKTWTQIPQAFSTQEPQDASYHVPQDAPSEKLKKRSPKEAETLSEAEKRQIKSREKNKKSREKRKQKKLQAMNEAEKNSKQAEEAAKQAEEVSRESESESDSESFETKTSYSFEILT